MNSKDIFFSLRWTQLDGSSQSNSNLTFATYSQFWDQTFWVKNANVHTPFLSQPKKMLIIAQLYASPLTKAPVLTPTIIKSLSTKFEEEKITAQKLAKKLLDQKVHNLLVIQHKNLMQKTRSLIVFIAQTKII